MFGGVIGKVTQFVELNEKALFALKIRQAESTLATTGDTEAHAANIAALKAEEAATQKLSLAKRALNAITSPIGIAIAAVAALTAAVLYLESINQRVADSAARLVASFDDKRSRGQEFTKLLELQIKYRDSLNKSNEELQILKDNEGDLLARYEDTTLALGERKKALDEYFIAAQKAKEKELEIAQGAADIAKQDVIAQEALFGNVKGSAKAEFYTKQSEAVQKLYEAQDKLNDFLTIEKPKKEREIFDQEIINDIELIR